MCLKQCTKCKLEKEECEFYQRKCRKKNHAWCKSCLNRHRKEGFLRDRINAIYKYSNGTMQCKCCGENKLGFLCLDHINGNGAKHRKLIGVDGSGTKITGWLRRENYPDGFQVLCANCNMSKGDGLICKAHAIKSNMTELEIEVFNEIKQWHEEDLSY